MILKSVLSCLSGYLNATSFTLDLPKVADVAEASEDEVLEELDNLKKSGDIDFDGTTITLLNIKPRTSKKFNDLYAPVETIEWKKGAKLKLDR